MFDSVVLLAPFQDRLDPDVDHSSHDRLGLHGQRQQERRRPGPGLRSRRSLRRRRRQDLLVRMGADLAHRVHETRSGDVRGPVLLLDFGHDLRHHDVQVCSRTRQ